MTDDLTPLVRSMKPVAQAAAEEQADFYSWTESAARRALDPDNAEVTRLTSAPVADPEIERLSRIAAEEAPKT
ncbi:hypothetical protein SRABI98_00968 [Microbacterium sp. Bi98]|uniref:hypothetical protein n=1 Tax=Microbacterium sp. Bi98 TaxID=2821116 RepID=UPI001DAE8374|nr:hypothetical protein [Microbacterium sp. Bi98]CAH0158730.1 hypothetical protein SRABI98_00968 [Microbacterium sp. Bi98]